MHLQTFASFYLKLRSRLEAIQHNCLLCHTRDNKHICQACCPDFFFSPSSCCSRCALSLAVPAELCGECLNTLPAFDHTKAAYIYQGALTQLLLRFKEQRDFIAGQTLATLFSQYIANSYQDTDGASLPTMITPVPLHWRRRWQRGFNQSLWFAQHMSKTLHIPCHADLLMKSQHIDPQKQLKRKQRLQLPADTFVAIPNSVQGQHIALVDDVMTTGATANAAALSLKRAGAARVSIWVLARAPKTTL